MGLETVLQHIETKKYSSIEEATAIVENAIKKRERVEEAVEIVEEAINNYEREFSHNSLENITTTDGRDARFTEGLRSIFSEGALHRYRGVIMIEHLISLDDSDLQNIPVISEEQRSKLREIVSEDSFDPRAVNDYDHFGRNGKGPFEHDVKSVEEYLKERLHKAGLAEFTEVVYFPMTSEDVNNLAYNLMFRDGTNLWLQKVLEVCGKLAKITEEYADFPVLGKTHGMNASPTTVGKKFGYTLDKLTKSLSNLYDLRLEGKFSGPVGNHNALEVIEPGFMEPHSQKFVESFGFDYASIEHQRNSHQSLVRLLDEIGTMNTFLEELCFNVRIGQLQKWFYQEGQASHVGSSVMPHKTNPWGLEGAQAGLEVAKALTSEKRGLIVGLLERDTTDHAWKKSIGEAVAKSITAMTYISKGLDSLRVNEKQILDDLKAAPEVLSEVIQVAGRHLGIPNMYMQLKELTRGKEVTYETLRVFVKTKFSDSDIKDRLLTLEPDKYTGIAGKLAKRAVANYETVHSKVSLGILHDLAGINTILFDFDNTLQLGVEEESRAHLSAISEEMNLGYTSKEIQGFAEEVDYRDMRKFMVEGYNKKNPSNLITEAEFQEVNNQVSGRYDDKFSLADKAKELIGYLKDKGYKVGLVTTRDSGSLPRLLKKHGLDSIFDIVIDRDDCKERKPHSEPLSKALEGLGANSGQAMYIGDNKVDVMAANGINMKSIQVTDEPIDLSYVEPTYRMGNLQEVLTLFERKDVLKKKESDLEVAKRTLYELKQAA